MLRLWCCSVDYQNDIPTSPQAIKEFGDKYRKVRNTLRYLISNVYDFNPNTDAQPVPANCLDGWALWQLDELIKEVRKAYDAYQLHRVFKLLHEFCTVQISAVYGNAMKDRLYCEAPNSLLRRRCQTVMHAILLAMTKLLAPMIVFTADEAWQHVPHKPMRDAHLDSVHLALFPEPSGQEPSAEQKEEWSLLLKLRDDAMTQITRITAEVKEREGKQAGYKALDAEVVFTVADPVTRGEARSLRRRPGRPRRLRLPHRRRGGRCVGQDRRSP